MLTLTALAALPLCLAPRLASAGAAGGAFIGCSASQQIRFVVDTDADGVRDSGENTTCTNIFVDETTNPDQPILHQGSPSGALCIPATQGQMSGTLTLMADDNSFDNGNGNTGQVVVMMLEMLHNNQVFRIADTFTSFLLGNLLIGNWDNRVQNEYNVFGVKFKGALFLTPAGVTPGALEPTGARLAQIADDLNLIPGAASTVIPIIANATRDGARKRFVQVSATGCGDSDQFPPVAQGCGELEVDQSGGTQALASVASYKVTVSFVQKTSGSPPACQ
jgi:hypothetical protein